jgi:AcrR family transcriptional regulator
MADKQDLSEIRKEQILQAATIVFARLGFYKARMDDIVEESGLSKGAVYWYFDSKDEIITTILDRFMGQSFENFRQISQEDGPVPDRLMSMMRDLAKEIEAISDLMPIIYEFYAVAAREEETRTTIHNYFKNYTELLEALIEEGIERGELRDVSSYDAALSIVSLVEGCMLIWTLEAFARRKSDLEALFESSLEFMFNGLMVED